MINVKVDDKLSKLSISSSMFEELTQTISDYLTVFRKNTHEDDVVILEVMEFLRYKIRKALGYSNNLPMPDNYEHNDCVELPIIEAFFYNRILQRAMDAAPEKSIHAERRETLATHIMAIDHELSTYVDQDYDEIVAADQEHVSFVYIDYLSYVYEHYSPQLMMGDRISLLMLLYKQIMRMKERPMQEKERLSFYHIQEYRPFKHYCDNWQKENEEEEIFLEDIIEDVGFAAMQ